MEKIELTISEETKDLIMAFNALAGLASETGTPSKRIEASIYNDGKRTQRAHLADIISERINKLLTDSVLCGSPLTEL